MNVMVGQHEHMAVRRRSPRLRRRDDDGESSEACHSEARKGSRDQDGGGALGARHRFARLLSSKRTSFIFGLVVGVVLLEASPYSWRPPLPDHVSMQQMMQLRDELSLQFISKSVSLLETLPPVPQLNLSMPSFPFVPFPFGNLSTGLFLFDPLGPLANSSSFFQVSKYRYK